MSDRAPAVFKVNAAVGPAANALENLALSAKRTALRRLKQLPEHEGSCVIIGGAPSIETRLEQIRAKSYEPYNILCSINCAHKWMLEHSIIPDIHVIFEEDVDPETVLGKAHMNSVYYVCSTCPPRVFDYLVENKVVLWHYWDADKEYDKLVNELFPGEFMVGGGYTTLFRTINIALLLGYREFDLFGIDSSFKDDNKQHFNGYPTKPSPEGLADIWVKGRKFRTLGALALQAEFLRRFCRANSDQIKVRVHSGGLLGYMLQDSAEGDKNDSSV